MNTRKSSVRLATYTTVHSAIDRLGNDGEKKMALLMYSEEVSSAPPVWTDLERPRESNEARHSNRKSATRIASQSLDRSGPTSAKHHWNGVSCDKISIGATTSLRSCYPPRPTHPRGLSQFLPSLRT